jgi:hypothetical protein
MTSTALANNKAPIIRMAISAGGNPRGMPAALVAGAANFTDSVFVA